MNCYVTIDTNVLVSALLSKNDNSATVKVLNRILLDPDIIIVYSKEIIKEYQDVLSRKKFGFNLNIVNYLISSIREYGISISPTPSNSVLQDMDDLPFYEVVLETQAITDNAYLITGNKKHFPMESYIVTPREFIDIIENENSMNNTFDLLL